MPTFKNKPQIHFPLTKKSYEYIILYHGFTMYEANKQNGNKSHV